MVVAVAVARGAEVRGAARAIFRKREPRWESEIIIVLLRVRRLELSFMMAGFSLTQFLRKRFDS